MIFIGLFAVSCFEVSKNITMKNFAGNYNPNIVELQPDYIVYNNSDSTSLLYISLNPEELLFNKANARNTLAAQIRFQYQIYSSLDANNLIDSASIEMNLIRRAHQKKLVSYLTLKTPKDQDYYVMINALDVLREESNSSVVYINRTKPLTTQSFLVNSVKDRSPFFHPYVSCHDTLIIDNNLKDIQDWRVDYYGKKFKLPPPPFSSNPVDSLKSEPDSSWVFKDAKPLMFRQAYEGLYHYKTNLSDKNGCIVGTYNEYFPQYKKPRQLIPPLQYLTSGKEFEDMIKNENPKIMLDDFWFKTTNDFDRARQLISIYYSRVFYANKYFTEHTEGWRTDRGMIYVIFGPPIAVYKTEDSEKWMYSDNKNYKSVTFVFKKTDSPLTENYFVLIRNLYFKQIWYAAVESWRNGTAFSMNN
jgi:GWxTD domain-containing protein